MSIRFRLLPFLTLLCLVASLTSRAQDAAQSFDFKSSYTRSSFYIPMRDGVRLFTTIYAPKDTSQKWPFIMTRTPYGIGPYAPGEFTNPREIMLKMLQEGYILVNQDVRGRNYSEGEFEDIRPLNAANRGKNAVDESTDAYDTIDWLVKSIPNNNGRVGVWGISYPGYYAGAAGVNSHPALKAISPEAPVSDWFAGDDDHHNGALFLLDYVGFFNGFGREKPKGAGQNPSRPTQMNMNNDAYKYYLDLGPLKNVDEKIYHGEVKHWTDVVNHPNYDYWWKDRSLPTHLKNVKCASLFVGGWYDAEDKYGPFADFAAMNRLDPGTPNSLMIGPWTHGGWAGGDFASFGDEAFGFKTGAWYRDNVFKSFFDYYLKDKGDWSKPKVTVFNTGMNQFWHFEEWPPKDTTPVKMTLGANKALSSAPPLANTGATFDSYVSDPANPVPYIAQTLGRRRNEYLNDDQRFAGERPDVLSYQSDPLTEDMPISGVISAKLIVSMTGTDADFIVKVIDVLPTGEERLVRAEVMRGQFRESLSDPKAFSPGKVTEVNYDLRDVSHTFLKGHRIMVQVQSSWFPLVDRNPQTFVPNIYKADEKDFQKETISIYHTSCVILPRLNHLPAAVHVDNSYLSPK